MKASKMMKGFKQLDGHYLQLNDFGGVEIEGIRPFFAKAFNHMRDLS